ncbi:MAG: ACP S-malonyltransferase [Chloroflexi bacterium]|nr:ACP S-malonyltransferase [Chloroflexota bacterium]
MTAGVVWLFPGQGSQHVGMGKALAERYASAARTFSTASEAPATDLRTLCWDGPQGELDRTANAQPAILTASIAALRATAEALGRDDPPEPLAVAGHSLGEYSAIVASGALSLPDAIRIVRRRGELMQAADASGGMAAVIGLDAAAIAAVIDRSGVVVANDNAPGQVVISGPVPAIAAVTDALKGAGAKRVIPLRVSAAFHSPAMRGVAAELGTALAAARWGSLRYRLIANVDADVHGRASELPALLERQAWSPVRWTETIRRAADMGATTFVEFGPGSVLSGLVKRILPEARTASVSDPASLEAALPLLGA